MIYKKIAGEFGCVDGELELSGGLNVVYAPNETGKSTWCALIRAVLYGVESSERARAGVLPVKTKYLPWSGRPAFGRLTVETGGRELVLTRQTQRGRMMQSFSAVYADTNQPVKELDAAGAGEALTGVPADVFARSLFCTGEQMAVTESAELERKIAAIAGTGDDEVSAGAANELLGAWKRERRFNSRGRIPQIEEQLRKNTAELAEIEELNGDMLRLGAALREAAAERDRLRADLAAFERGRASRARAKAEEAEAAAAAAAERAEQFCKAHDLNGDRGDDEACMRAAEQFRLAAGREAECRVAEAEYYRAKKYAAECRCPERLTIFDGCTAAFARETAAADCRRCEEMLGAKPKSWLFFAAALSAAAGVLLKLPKYYDSLIGTVFLFLLGGAGLVLAGLGVASVVKSRRLRAAGAALCESYGAEKPVDMIALAAEYEGYVNECRLRADAAEAAAKTLLSLQEKRDFVKNGAERCAAALKIPLDSDAPAAAEELARLNRQYRQLCGAAESAAAAYRAVEDQLAQQAGEQTEAGEPWQTLYQSEEETRARLAEAEERLRREERALAACEGRLSHYRDMAFLSAENARLREELDTLNLEYEAIEAAQDWLAACSGELAGRLTPKLCTRAGELFTAMTGGKYGELLLDKRFSAEVREAGGLLPRSMLHLSRGALDQLYLAVRLALSEVFFEPPLPPLVLDDCLAAFDDDRAEQTMALLAELSRSRQILLFTCRGREAETAKRFGAKEAALVKQETL